MAEQLPTITKSHAVNTTASPASSLLRRGLNAIQSRKLVISEEYDENKLCEIICQAIDTALKNGHFAFKQNARFVLDSIQKRFGDDAAKTVSLRQLQGMYIAMVDDYTNQGTSLKDIIAVFKSLGDLYLEEELLKVGIETAVYHIKRGIRKYPEYTQVMITSLGENIRPYLAQIYVCIKFQPEPDFDNSGMEDAETIERIISANQGKADSQHD
ncbi:hypothetical protein BCS42_03745 [Crenothrix sp. D3]|nr:hypothetical protein BCS42_03745 [Crenothrix sp. D3]